MCWAVGLKEWQQEEAAQERGTEATQGQYADVSVSEDDVQKAANFAVQVLAGASNSLYPLTLKQVWTPDANFLALDKCEISRIGRFPRTVYLGCCGSK